MKRKFTAWILLAVLFVSLLPVSLSANQPAQAAESRYCRNQLEALSTQNEKYADYVAAYDRIRAAAEAYPETTTLAELGYQVDSDISDRETAVDLSKLSVYSDDFEVIIEAYRNDYPEYFWLKTSSFIGVTYRGSEDGSPHKYEAVILEFLFSADELPAAKNRFDAAVADYLGKVTATDEYGIAKQLHDMLAENIWYTEYNNAHDAYGALVDGYAVCEGYTRAYQYLLMKKGVECLVESGTSRDEGHAWNKVKINGIWTNVDVTWDDSEHFLFHEYFCSPDSVFYRDHNPTVFPYDLPACTDSSLHLFDASYTPQTLTVDAVVDQLKASKKGRAAFCSFEYVSSEDLLSWFRNNYEAVVQGLDIYGEKIQCGFVASYGDERISGSGSDEYYLYVYDGDMGFYDMSVTVGSDLSVHFTALCDEGSVVRILRDGKYLDLEGTKLSDGVYDFVYTGITPQCIGDLFNAILTVNGINVHVMENMTLADYFETLVTNSAKVNGLTDAQQSALRTFIADLFNFATEAQNYTHYRTDDPVNAPSWVDTYETDAASLPTASMLSVQRILQEPGTAFTSAAVRLGNAVNICYKFKVTDASGMVVRVYRGDQIFDECPLSVLTPNGDGIYAFYTSDLPAYEFDIPYTAVLCHGDTEVIACTYSVDSYIYASVSNPALAPILTALSIYGSSAYNFLLACSV